VATELLPNVTYYWRVRAVDGVGNFSGWSNIYRFIITFAGDTIPPGKVNNLSAESGPYEGSVLLKWTVSGDDGYTGGIFNGECRIDYTTVMGKVWRLTTYKIKFSTTIPAGSSVAYLVEGLLPGTSYYFAIWLADENYNWSELSNIATGFSKPKLLSPTLVSPVNNVIFVTTNNVTFVWSEINNAVKYHFQLGKNLDFMPVVVETQVSQPYYRVILPVNDIYFWRVRSIDQFNNVSDWSDVYSFTVNFSTTEALPTATYRVIEESILPQQINYLPSNSIDINNILTLQTDISTLTIDTVKIVYQITYKDGSSSPWEQVNMAGLTIDEFFVSLSLDSQNISKINYYLTVTLNNGETIQTEQKEVFFEFNRSQSITSSGGKIQLVDPNITDGETYIDIPRNVIYGTKVVSLSQYFDIKTLPPNELVGVKHDYPVAAVKVEGLPRDISENKIICSVLYSEQNLSLSDEKKLRMFYYDGTQWRYVKSSVNSANNTVVGNISQNGIYGIFVVDGVSFNQCIPNQKIITATKTSINQKLIFPMLNYYPDSEIKIFDIKGRLVRRIINSDEWDGKDDTGNIVSSGVYIYRITANNESLQGTVLIIK
ncbi:MAG: gliding motility-associated C-terminal domain-containing protein, partial [Endomicrobia bacterium]|nr:gliding motility-associated C-terminal domain-containing protein [Endomicrobiia bacterium]